METTARAGLRPVLVDFDSAIMDIYEAGVQVPTLPGGHSTESLRLAALFLKRTLVDLRATWQLVGCGYTSSAASVAASLFEHALACEILATQPTRADELRQSGGGDIPWSPRQLARLASTEAAAHAGLPPGVAEERSRNAYASYKWLCKVKHPTLRSTIHGAHAHEADDGAFVVMAAPDLRATDVPVKRMLLTIALGRTVQAIKAFASTLEPDQDDPTTRDFTLRLNRGEAALLAIVRSGSHERLPFTLTRAEGSAL